MENVTFVILTDIMGEDVYINPNYIAYYDYGYDGDYDTVYVGVGVGNRTFKIEKKSWETYVKAFVKTRSFSSYTL